MMTERTSAQSLDGSARLPGSSASQSMSPCQPSASAASSLALRSGRAAGEVTPKASKPSVLARARISARAALFAGNVLFHQQADVARIGHAARFCLVLDRIEQRLRHAHVDLRFLLLELEMVALELREVVFGQIFSEESLGFLVSCDPWQLLLHTTGPPFGACNAR